MANPLRPKKQIIALLLKAPGSEGLRRTLVTIKFDKSGYKTDDEISYCAWHIQPEEAVLSMIFCQPHQQNDTDEEGVFYEKVTLIVIQVDETATAAGKSSLILFLRGDEPLFPTH